METKQQDELNLKWIDGTEISVDSNISQWQSEDKALIDKQTLKSLFYSEDWIFITVDAIAQPLSRVPWGVFRKINNEGKTTYVADDAHPLNKLLENPSAHVDSATFKYMMFSEDALMGNAFIYHARQLNELHIVPSEVADYVFDKRNNYPEYLRINAQDLMQKPMTVSVADVIHVMRPHVSNKYWGLSPFIPTRKSILFQKYSTDFLNAFYQRGATPQAILELEKEANEQNATRLLKKFEAAYSGRKNQRRTMILPKGVKFSSTEIKIADQQFLELVNLNRENILNALHIPKHVVSLNEAGSLGSEEFKQALKYFWTATLIPITERIAGRFTKHFAKELGPDRVIAFNFDDIEVMQEDRSQKALLAKDLLSVMTVNEIRKDLFELPALPEGNTLIGAQAPISLPQASLVPEVEPQPTQEQLAIPAVEEKELRPEIVAGRKWIEKNKDKVDTITMLIDSEETSKVASFKQKAENFLDKQTAMVMEALKKTLKQKAKFNEERFNKEYDKLVDEASGEYQDEYVNSLTNTMELGYRSQLGVIIGGQDRRAIEALRKQGTQRRRAILEARGLDVFKWTSQTTGDYAKRKTKQVLDAIASGMEESKTIKEIADEVQNSVLKYNRSRAETIARTEVLTAVSFGQEAMQRDAAEVVPNLVKIWLNAGDNRVRGNPNGLYPEAEVDHWEVHGEVVPLKRLYSNGLMFPRDPRKGPEGSINCRCKQITVAKEDLDTLDIPGVLDIPKRD